jgi:heme ABC exporter ATP-binding subunit CcmA
MFVVRGEPVFSGASKTFCRSGLALQLTVRDLSKAYRLRWALRDLSLDLVPGECIALLGPNGAGKTTLLKLLAGLIYPTRGNIRLNGAELSRTSTDLRATIGFLTPGEHLYENLTARENLDFFTALYSKNNSSAVIENALEEVGLTHWSGEYAAALSSGMKFRLSMAKWRLLEPGLLLLDEPYGVLDGSGVNFLETFLKSQCEKGNVIVIASHHISRVLQLCTRALILHQGKLTFDEPRRQPWDSFERAFADFLPHGGP